MLKIELEKTADSYCCRAFERTRELGRVQLRREGDCVRFLAAALEDTGDYGLLDGLVRAGLDAARNDGAAAYLIPADAAGDWLRGFETYDYAIDTPEELDRFFSRHSCKGLSS